MTIGRHEQQIPNQNLLQLFFLSFFSFEKRSFRPFFLILLSTLILLIFHFHFHFLLVGGCCFLALLLLFVIFTRWFIPTFFSVVVWISPDSFIKNHMHYYAKRLRSCTKRKTLASEVDSLNAASLNYITALDCLTLDISLLFPSATTPNPPLPPLLRHPSQSLHFAPFKSFSFSISILSVSFNPFMHQIH